MSGCFLCKHAQPRFQYHPNTKQMLIACEAQKKDVSEVQANCPYFEKHTAALMSRYYDKAGKSITLEEWGELNSDYDYRCVGRDKRGLYTVSTMWLGIDHGCGGSLLIFETIVLKKGVDYEVACARYTTEEEAKQGHATLLKFYKDRHIAFESICSIPVVKVTE